MLITLGMLTMELLRRDGAPLLKTLGVALMRIVANPLLWGIALGAVFLPSFLMVIGALPFWSAVRSKADFQSALRGINAAVVGLLLAALYQPVWTSAIGGPADFALAIAALGLLVLWQTPPWLVVVLAALAGAALGAR